MLGFNYPVLLFYIGIQGFKNKTLVNIKLTRVICGTSRNSCPATAGEPGTHGFSVLPLWRDELRHYINKNRMIVKTIKRTKKSRRPEIK